MKFDEQNFDEFTVVFVGKERLDDELLAFHQIHQNFLPSNFCAIYGIRNNYVCMYIHIATCMYV